MKPITIRIDDEQFNKLQNIAKTYKINGISCLIRRAIDVYIMTFPECDSYIQYIKERRTPNEYDEHEQRNRQSSFQENSSKHKENEHFA